MATSTMVELIYSRNDPLLAVSPQEDEEHVVDTSVSSQRMFEIMERDTSHTHRDDARDDTRQSVQTSLLNCTGDTEDDDEEIEEPGSFLFAEDDFHSPLNQSLDQSFQNEDVALVAPAPASPSHQQKALCCVNDRWLDLQNVTDSFVSFCSSRADEPPCGLSDLMTSTEDTTCSGNRLRNQVEFDLMQLLGCDEPTKTTLTDVTWFSPLLIKASPAPYNSNASAPPVVRRSSPGQRAERIRRIRNQVLGEQARIVSPTRSMDEDLLLDKLIGGGMDPIERQEEDEGYDSDPGQVLVQSSVPARSDSLRDTSLLDDEEDHDEEYHFYDGHRARIAEEYSMRMQHRGPRDEYDREVYDSVHDAMNATWTLTWHGEGNNPTCIHFWVERGTLLNHGSVVVEPKFMWRQVYQPTLATFRTLNESCRKPMDVRVLNACRIIEAGDKLDRSKYPMARSACSFFLKTCRDETFLFEASSPEEKELIMRQWKLVVARLASLAVVEDMESMAKEFFTPAVNSQMLTTRDA